MNSKEVYAAIRNKFAPPAWCVLTEVGNATGFGCNRHADAIAMSLWPSRGLELYGIEVKVSRADWLKELENPAKAESIFKFCDRWFLAVSNRSIVLPGELPPTWGLLAIKGDKLTVVIEAPKLEAHPITRGFLASLLRKSVEQSLDESEKKAIKDGEYNRGHEDGVKSGKYEEKNCRDELVKLSATVSDFEEASGVSIRHVWTGATKIGQAVRRVLDGNTPPDLVNHVLSQMDRAAKILRELLPTTDEETRA